MYDESAKFRQYRALVYALTFILLFEVGMLAWAIPERTTFIVITLSALGFLCLYLVVLCLRLIRELEKNTRGKS